MRNSNNCKYIIFVEQVDHKKNIIPNMLILSEKQYLEKYFEKNYLENDIYLVISNFSYSNNKIGVLQLKYFDKYIWKK